VLDRLIGALRAAGLDPDPEGVADALWLATWAGAPAWNLAACEPRGQ